MDDAHEELAAALGIEVEFAWKKSLEFHAAPLVDLANSIRDELLAEGAMAA